MSSLREPIAVSPSEAIQIALKTLGKRWIIGTPLGLGKPNEWLNAFYRHAQRDRSVDLTIVTALSLDPPQPRSDLERRFLAPFVARHFGADYPRLAWLDDLRRNAVPPNIRISEFYLQPGAALTWEHSQRHYVASNYTHVARDMADRGVNLILQMVAATEARPAHYSLSCNPDVTLDLVDLLTERGADYLAFAVVHPELPYLGRGAEVPRSFFTHAAHEPATHKLFALPATPVSSVDHAIGMHASTLVPDGGTLQVGIGALSDALTYALILRHRENAEYRRRARAIPVDEELAQNVGGLDALQRGLYGASELLMDGFAHLWRAGILHRPAFPDLAAQRAALEAEPSPPWPPGTTLLQAAFFLGSERLYQFLRELDPAARELVDMTRVSVVNQLYGGAEALETLQRRDARFLNTCMKMTLLGDAVSETLADGRVVSGVGGQYNFVAMAHAMTSGRSILMLRSTRQVRGRLESNVVQHYGRTTIPRHLRDIVITEYGVADLRGRSDRECIAAMLAVSDARCIDELADRAMRSGKLEPSFTIPDAWRQNLPERIQSAVPVGDNEGQYPAFPLGCDFDPTERRLVEALGWLQSRRHGWQGRLELAREVFAGGDRQRFASELQRMRLDRPRGWRERVARRLVTAALAATSR